MTTVQQHRSPKQTVRYEKPLAESDLTDYVFKKAFHAFTAFTFVAFLGSVSYLAYELEYNAISIFLMVFAVLWWFVMCHNRQSRHKRSLSRKYYVTRR